MTCPSGFCSDVESVVTSVVVDAYAPFATEALGDAEGPGTAVTEVVV